VLGDYSPLVAHLGSEVRRGLPLLLIYGEDDALVPVCMRDRLSKRLEGAVTAVVSRSGHNVPLHGAFSVIAELARFLDAD
jgi:pimeloyl-ACP methyl ester carboxylesterase